MNLSFEAWNNNPGHRYFVKKKTRRIGSKYYNFMHLLNCVKFKRISRSAYEELLLVVQISLTRNSLEIFQGKPKDSALGIIARISTRLKKKNYGTFFVTLPVFCKLGGKGKQDRASYLTMTHSSVHVALRKKVNEFVDSSRRQSLPRNTGEPVLLYDSDAVFTFHVGYRTICTILHCER